MTEEAKRRVRILNFWQKYSLKAAVEAFGTTRRTLFLWKKKLVESGGKVDSLNNKSKAPKTKRKRRWDWRIVTEIEKIRREHPNLGKEKLYPELKLFCGNLNLKCLSSKTIGRIIKDKGGMRLFPQKVSHFGKIKKANRAKVLRKPKDIKAEYPGYLIALDTVERFVQGCKRYIITFEDIYTRFSFAWATTSHASKAAQEFFILCQKVFPYSFNFLHILTDNGSEFKKHFSEELKKLHLTHYHTYPKTPKMNAHIERFNRTIQEEFVDYHTGLLVNPEEFNKKLMDYLVWFNTKRVHCAFKNKLSPVQFMLTLPVVQLIQVQSLPLSINIPQECKSGWPYTPPSFLQFFVLK